MVIKQKEPFENGIPYEISCFLQILDMIPTAKVKKIIHGAWHPKMFQGYARGFSCSNCKKVSDEIFIYCPHCGAVMDGESNG
jgi:hypothetical protein